MAQYVIGLDFGGGGGRCLLLDVDSGETAFAAHPSRCSPVPGTGGLGFTVDLERVWRHYGEGTREVLARAGAAPGQVVGVAATSTRHGNVLLDASGEVLLAVPNRDARATAAGLTLAAEHGEALHRATGRWPLPIHAAARVSWLRDTRPHDLDRVAHLVSIADWIAFRLSGEIASDPTQAAETLLLDLASGSWSDEWIERLGVPRGILPEIAAPGARLGALTLEAAAHLGLAAGTPVAVGAGDTQCALLACGAVAPGEVAMVAGTTGPVQQVVGTPLLDDAQRTWTDPHALPGHFVLESNGGPFGEALEWLARLLHPEAAQPVARLLGEARESSPGACGMVSSLGAEVMNARAMGLPVGHLTFSHLTSAEEPAPRRHLARAVLEGMACGLRANLEQIESVTGLSSPPPLLTGGLARSDTFVRIVCDVLDRPVRVGPGRGASALGAALCATVAAGLHPDLASAAGAHGVRSDELMPAASEASRDVFGRWSRLREARRATHADAQALIVPFAFGGDGGADVAEETHRPRILVTAEFDERSLERLGEIAEVAYEPFRKMGRMLKEQALVDALHGYEVFVTEIDLVDAGSLERLSELRVVASCRGDAVNVDVAGCSAFGVPVLNTPGRNADAVADLTVALMLMLARRLPEAERFLHAPGIPPGDLATLGRAFAAFQGRELWHKTVGLVGLGAVGRMVASRLRGFGVRLLAHDPFVDGESAAQSDVEVAALETLLEESDFVSLHAAVTPETTGLLGARELALMKPDAFLVNTARAALVDEPALVAALDAGRIAGAALDTFAVEPPGSDHPLLAMDQVISTPHIGGNTVDVAAHQGEIVADDLTRMLSGGRPRHALNPHVLDDFSWRGPRRTPSPEEVERLREGPAPAVSDLQKKKSG